VLLPAPEGPRIAVSCPDLKRPLTLLRIIFFPANIASVSVRAVHSDSQEEFYINWKHTLTPIDFPLV
jgi:hypothetical protein